MKKYNVLLLSFFILLLLNSCIVFERIYREPIKENHEGSTDKRPILTFINLMYGQSFKFPFSCLQPVFPLAYEKYNIWFTVSNRNDIFKIEDIMRSMYIDEFRIVLPSGKIIDLLDGNIDVTYHYNGSEEETGMLYKEEQNIKPQNIDGEKKLFFEGIKDGDGVSIYFHTRIPAYFVNQVRMEYMLTIEWENRGIEKRRYVGIFNKKFVIFNMFPTV